MFKNVFINVFIHSKGKITSKMYLFYIYIFNTTLQKVDIHRNAFVEWYLVGHRFSYFEQSAAYRPLILSSAVSKYVQYLVTCVNLILGLWYM